MMSRANSPTCASAASRIASPAMPRIWPSNIERPSAALTWAAMQLTITIAFDVRSQRFNELRRRSFVRHVADFHQQGLFTNRFANVRGDRSGEVGLLVELAIATVHVGA